MRQKRSFPITFTRADGEVSDTVRIAISTEAPCCRYIPGVGMAHEVLGHAGAELDLTYLADGAPFLFEHDTLTQIGVLENISVDPDKVLRADVRFSKSVKGQEIKQDILDGIRKRISVGYDVQEYQPTGESIDDIPVVRAVRWTAYEASTVSIPADLAAGVGRSLQPDQISELLEGLSEEDRQALRDQLTPPVETPTEETSDPVVEEEEVKAAETPTEEPTDPPTEEPVGEPEPDEESDESTTKSLLKDMNTTTPAHGAALKELNHMSELDNGSVGADKDTVKRDLEKITQLAVRHNMTDKLPSWIAEGRSYDSVAAEVLESRSNDSKVTSAPAVHTRAKVTDVKGAVKAFLQNDSSEIAERGLDQQRAAGQTVVPGALYIPTDVAMFERSRIPQMFKSTTYGTNVPANGANAVGKQFLTWEETLREGALLSRVGGSIITLNQVGAVSYFATPATASMAYETGSASTSAVSVGQRNWTPKRIVARYAFSNLLGLLNGTYDFESELYNELIGEGVRKFEQQIWAGNGTNEFTGIVFDSNIAEFGNSGSFSLGSGSAMITNVANRAANVEAGAFVLNHSTFGYLQSAPAFGNGSGTSILDRLQAQNPVLRTGYLPSGISGSLKAMFGDFSKVTAATFGPPVITRDNLTALATGETILNFELFGDVVARQPDALVRWSYIIPS